MDMKFDTVALDTLNYGFRPGGRRLTPICSHCGRNPSSPPPQQSSTYLAWMKWYHHEMWYGWTSRTNIQHFIGMQAIDPHSSRLDAWLPRNSFCLILRKWNDIQPEIWYGWPSCTKIHYSTGMQVIYPYLSPLCTHNSPHNHLRRISREWNDIYHHEMWNGWSWHTKIQHSIGTQAIEPYLFPLRTHNFPRNGLRRIVFMMINRKKWTIPKQSATKPISRYLGEIHELYRQIRRYSIKFTSFYRSVQIRGALHFPCFHRVWCSCKFQWAWEKKTVFGTWKANPDVTEALLVIGREGI